MDYSQVRLAGQALKNGPALQTACSRSMWLDPRVVPAYVSVVSLIVLFIVWLCSAKYPQIPPASDTDDSAAPSSLRRRLAAHIHAIGGPTIFAFNVVRFLGAMALTVLSVVAVFLRSTQSAHWDCETWTEIPIALAYGYAAILSLMFLILEPWKGRACNIAVATTLFAQFAVFAWRNLVPFTMFGGTPADNDIPWLLWSRGALIILVGVIVPLFVPWVYIPADPQNPMPTPSPEQTASLISFVFYFWVDPIILAAYRTPSLPYDALPPLPDDTWATTLAARAMDVLDPLRRRELGRGELYLAWGIAWVFRWEWARMAALLVGQLTVTLLGPIGINRLLTYLETGGEGAVVRPWVWIACIFLAPVLNTLIYSFYTYTNCRMVVQAESLFAQLLLHHAFRLRITDDSVLSVSSTGVTSSSTAGSSTPVNGPTVTPSGSSSESATVTSGEDAPADNKKKPASKEVLGPMQDTKASSKTHSSTLHLSAKINNLFGTDIANIIGAVDILVVLVDVPLQSMLCVYFLYVVLGWSALVGIALLAITMPLPGLIVRRIQNVQRVQMQKTDQRVQSITESLSIIRMVKMFAWESLMRDQIFDRRNDELHYIQTRKLLELANDILLGVLPMASMTASYAFYTLVLKKELDAARVFSSLPVFDQLSDILSSGLSKVTSCLKGKVSIDRITEFLNKSLLLDRYQANSLVPLSAGPLAGSVIGFHHASFTWIDHTLGPLLPGQRDFRLHLDDLVFENGAINLIVGPTGCGKTSMLMALLGEMHYAPQTPDSWVNLPRERGVAYAAQESWVQNTTIKENIVFGNRYDEERYREVIHQCGLGPDLELFSARDETEVGERGLTLSGGQKARVTLARAIYSSADILLLDDILSALDVHTARWVVEQCLQGHIVKGRTVIMVTHAVALIGPIAAKVISLGANGRVTSQGSLASALPLDATLREKLRESDEELEAILELPLSEPVPDKKEPEGKLTVKEEMAAGRLQWASLKLLLDGFGSTLGWISSLSGLTLAVALDTVAMWWLGQWSQAYEAPVGQVNVPYYLGVFVGLVILQQVSYGTGSTIYTFGTIRASQQIHAALCNSVLTSTLRWLDSTPVGRIISRFTQDIAEIDGTLTQLGQTTIRLTIKLILKFGAVIVISPAFLLPGIMITALGLWLGHIYLIGQMAVKRIRSNWRSPMYNHLGAAVTNLVSIRAYGAEDKFEGELRTRADGYSRPSRTFFNLNRWIAARMNFLGAIFSASLATYLVYSRRDVSASNTGFSLHMAVEFSGMILWWIRNFNYVEVSANSLERIRDYLTIPHETAPTVQGMPPAYWPASGALRVEGLCARYSEDGPVVLQDINFSVKSGERVGIVGRTGSGKSSLALSLLRLIPTTGEIFFDGRRTGEMNLDALRSNLTIIPQEPTLMSGTLRSNLDPYSQYEDAALYDALRATGLITPGGTSGFSNLNLDSTVTNGGSNFSVGQRQLISLARAILRRTRVLLLDEATASVDVETDAIIQTSIRVELKHATLLTIAHRLLTIMDYDKILVLDSGRLVEFDTPRALLQDEKSHFYSLVEESGDRDRLTSIAQRVS